LKPRTTRHESSILIFDEARIANFLLKTAGGPAA
jgi:hypothetical protein